MGERDTQEIRVLSSRALRAAALVTVQRPDIAESMHDYGYVKCGFQLRVSTTDGRPVQPEEIVFVAKGTSPGDMRIGQQTVCATSGSRTN